MTSNTNTPKGHSVAAGEGERIWLVGDTMTFKTRSLSRRFGHGEYGHIGVPEPGNPQVTNRRVNHGILDAARNGRLVQVWFHKTAERDPVESFIIERLDLPWNREGLSAVNRVRKPFSPAVGSGWGSVIRQAEAAKRAFLQDRAEGERLFAHLLAAHPSDGMVYMKRAEALEARGDMPSAARDFARAEELLPFPARKAEARAGRLRTGRAG